VLDYSYLMNSSFAMPVTNMKLACRQRPPILFGHINDKSHKNSHLLHKLLTTQTTNC
jgi:hypothetical protein